MAISWAYVDNGKFLFVPRRDCGAHIIVPRDVLERVGEFQNYSFKIDRKLWDSEKADKARSLGADILAEFSPRKFEIKQRAYYAPFFGADVTAIHGNSLFFNAGLELDRLDAGQRQDVRYVSGCRNLLGKSVAFRVKGFPGFLQILQEKAKLLEP